MPVYTSVSRFDKLATIRRTRMLPYPGEVLTPVGSQVNAVQVVARAPDYMDYKILRASDRLGVPPEELDQYILVEEGTMLKKGTPLMRQSGIFGRSKVFRSPVEGFLNQIRDGCLVVQRVGQLIELRAQIPGRIISTLPDRGVVIEGVGASIQAIWDSGKDGLGRLARGSKTAADELQMDVVGNKANGSVLVAGTATDVQLLHRLEDQGLRGLIVGSLSWKMAKAVTDLSYPVFITDGIGTMPMNELFYDYLVGSEGREVSMLAADHGPQAQPAEIFLPLPATRKADRSTPTLSKGSTVRVLQPGGVSVLGLIGELHHRPHKNAFGSPMPGAEVELKGGERKFVPYTNLELLHE